MFSPPNKNYHKSKLIQETIFSKKEILKLEEFIEKRDYTGALALLEFERNCEKSINDTDLWIGYSAFHLGDFNKALEEYNKLSENCSINSEVLLYVACCYYFLGKKENALKLVNNCSPCPLQKRLFFYLTNLFNHEKRIINLNMLDDSAEDQLCLASLHFLRNNYKHAKEIYQKIMSTNRDYIALNYYLALCCYQLDETDLALEFINYYIHCYPDSASALNLKIAINFKCFGKIKEPDLKELQDLYSSPLKTTNDLIKHNLVVFRNGEGAIQVISL